MRGNRLGRHSARPEDRNLAFADLDGISEIRSLKISNSDGFRVAGLNRCAMRKRITLANSSGELCLRRCHRSHGDHEIPLKWSGTLTRNVRPEHRNVTALLDVTDGDVLLKQCILKGERATQQKANGIFGPMCNYVERLFNQIAVSIDAITGKVRAKVGTWCDLLRFGVSDGSHFQKRTRLGISLTEKQEVVCEGLRKNDEIGLHVTGSETGGGPGQFSTPSKPSDVSTGIDLGCHVAIPVGVDHVAAVRLLSRFNAIQMGLCSQIQLSVVNHRRTAERLQLVLGNLFVFSSCFQD